MSKPDFSDQVLAALAAVQRVITQMDEQGVIIGGVAANLLGAPRFTTDVDAVVQFAVATDGVRAVTER